MERAICKLFNMGEVDLNGEGKDLEIFFNDPFENDFLDCCDVVFQLNINNVMTSKSRVFDAHLTTHDSRHIHT